MKRHWKIVVGALTLGLTLATNADAQRGGGGGRGGGGVGPGGAGRGGGWYGGGGYGYGGVGRYGGVYSPYYRGYGVGRPYAWPSYGQPGYANDGYEYQSNYPPVDVSQVGFRMRILLPTENAQVWIAGEPTQQRGFVRVFEAPALEPGSYSYEVRARWRENGRDVSQTRTIRFHAGDSMTVDFRPPSEELLPPP